VLPQVDWCYRGLLVLPETIWRYRRPPGAATGRLLLPQVDPAPGVGGGRRCSRSTYLAGAPWQRLNLRPEPHGQGAFFATCPHSGWSAAVVASTTVPDRWAARVSVALPPAPSTVGAEYSSRAGRFGWVRPLATMLGDRAAVPAPASAGATRRAPVGGAPAGIPPAVRAG
jgi:hypothetical protein